MRLLLSASPLQGFSGWLSHSSLLVSLVPFFANFGSYRRTEFELAINTGDMLRAADLYLNLSSKGIKRSVRVKFSSIEGESIASSCAHGRMAVVDVVQMLWRENEVVLKKAADGVLNSCVKQLGDATERGNKPVLDVLVKLANDKFTGCRSHEIASLCPTLEQQRALDNDQQM